jgi:hypothetical protein
VTTPFFRNLAVHVEPHEIPAGELDTLPVPAPDLRTVSVLGGGAAPPLGTITEPVTPNTAARMRPTTARSNRRM